MITQIITLHYLVMTDNVETHRNVSSCKMVTYMLMRTNQKTTKGYKMKIILTLFLAMIVACSNSETTATSYFTNESPISLYKTSVGKTLKKSITSIEEMQEESFDIDFDTIPTTTESWLIITNNSEDTITDLSIVSDNPTFVITPDTIVTICPFESNVGLMQMIKVTIINGASSSGLGVANVIHGNQYATITISGKIRDTAFSTNYTFHAYGKRLLVYVDTTAVNLGFGKDGKRIEHLFAHVDSTSDDCYLTYISSIPSGIVTIDTSYLSTFDINSFAKINSDSIIQVTDSTMYKKYMAQFWVANSIISGYADMDVMDQNCATMIMIRTSDNISSTLYNTNVILK